MTPVPNQIQVHPNFGIGLVGDRVASLADEPAPSEEGEGAKDPDGNADHDAKEHVGSLALGSGAAPAEASAWPERTGRAFIRLGGSELRHSAD